MKTISKLGLMLALAGSLFVSSCAGTYYVYDRPLEPVYERPVAPYAGAIWIDGDWTWNGGKYVFVRGHWDRPRQGHFWVRGEWMHTNRGYRWHKGYWR
jgi:hypothetical protein